MKLKGAISTLTNTQKALLLFATCVIPTAITWLEQVATGNGNITIQSWALLGAGILGGVLVFAFKMLDSDA